MLVMLQVTDPVERDHTMTKREEKGEVVGLKGLLSRDEDFVRSTVQALVQEALEAEMTEAIGAAKGECMEGRLSYRSGYYGRTLITRVGTLELRVPQDRAGRFSTELFERYQRSEKALVAALAEMYVQGVSTRKVKAVTETLCDQPKQQRTGCESDGICRAASGGGLSLHDPGHTLRAGARTESDLAHIGHQPPVDRDEVTLWVARGLSAIAVLMQALATFGVQ